MVSLLSQAVSKVPLLARNFVPRVNFYTLTHLFNSKKPEIDHPWHNNIREGLKQQCRDIDNLTDFVIRIANPVDEHDLDRMSLVHKALNETNFLLKTLVNSTLKKHLEDGKGALEFKDLTKALLHFDAIIKLGQESQERRVKLIMADAYYYKTLALIASEADFDAHELLRQALQLNRNCTNSQSLMNHLKADPEKIKRLICIKYSSLATCQ